MNKQKEIFDMLHLSDNGCFIITEPHFKGLYKLTKDLYINKCTSDVWEQDSVWEACQFQLCDLLNGTLIIKPIGEVL